MVEERCNSAIQDAIPVSVKLFQIGDPELDAVNIIRGSTKKYETIIHFIFEVSTIVKLRYKAIISAFVIKTFLNFFLQSLNC